MLRRAVTFAAIAGLFLPVGLAALTGVLFWYPNLLTASERSPFPGTLIAFWMSVAASASSLLFAKCAPRSVAASVVLTALILWIPGTDIVGVTVWALTGRGR